MSNSITKTIDLKAPIDRVWQALSDYQEFGAWFGLKLESAFAPGKTSKGIKNNSCGENAGKTAELHIQKMDKPKLFSYKWRPYNTDSTIDYSAEPPTLVEFRLESIPSGTRLTVTESGFDAIPAHRKAEAFPMHEKGWTSQMENVRKHVER